MQQNMNSMIDLFEFVESETKLTMPSILTSKSFEKKSAAKKFLEWNLTRSPLLYHSTIEALLVCLKLSNLHVVMPY